MNKLMTLTIICLTIISCKKTTSSSTTTTPTPSADTTPPVITLTGNTNDTVSLNMVYTDPGATAMDNVDGNITSKIVISGSINKDLVGDYRLYYNVKDAAGNNAAQLTRYIYVANDARHLVGNYSANPNCGASPTSGGTFGLSASTTLNNEISISIPGNVSNITPKIMVSGNALSIPLQLSGSNSIVGNGTIAANKLSFSLTYTSVSSTPGSNGGTWNCSTSYTRQ